MGEIRNIACKECGNVWARTEGRGFISISLHCNRCGEERVIEIEKMESKVSCACGGDFSKNKHPIICPQCKSGRTKWADDVVMMWD